MIIPKIFHRAWVGNKPIPDQFEAYWRGWQELHPDFWFLTWTEEYIESFRLKNHVQYLTAAEAAGKTDIAMYEILHRFGGIWLCCDMECFENVEPLITDVTAFCGRQTPTELLGAIMGFVPEHPLARRLVENIPQSVEQNRGVDLCAVAGPVYLTRQVEAHFGKPAGEITDVEGFRVLESKLVYPYLWTEEYRGRQAYPEAYCAHHWTGSWITKG